MPPACTPEKHYENNQNGTEEEVGPMLGYVTPPRNAYNSNTKYMDREDRHIEWICKKLPTLASVFRLHKQIGEGTFSAVFMASMLNDPAQERLFAIKHLVPTTHPKRIEVELHCLKVIGGINNVVGLDLCLRENDNIVLVMPYLQHKQFQDYVYDMDAEEAALYIKNLLQAVFRVHSFGIIHRDIKPNNFLYDRENKKFLLVDFGLAQVSNTDTPDLNITINQTQQNKRKRDCDEGADMAVNCTEVSCEPSAKRPALHSKNMYSLNSTVSHLQKCLTVDMTSKENIPTDSELYQSMILKKSLLKSPNHMVEKTLKKSPFKFPGLDLLSTHSKMTNKIHGQRKLFQTDNELETTKTHSPANITPAKEKNLTQDVFPKPHPVTPKPNHSSTKSDCKCFGKPSICTVCLVRKVQEAPRAGTPGFRPPEVLLKYAKQTTAVDIWAVGVIMLCILSGSYPFFRAPDDITALAEMITLFGDEAIKKLANIFGRQLTCSEKRPALDLRKICCKLRARGNQNIKKFNTKCQSCVQYIHNCVCIGTPMDETEDLFPDSAYDLLKRFLDINPYTRITAKEALKHPFLNSIQCNK